MRAGDPVFYVPDPALYGEMEIHHVRSDGRIVCRVDPDSEDRTTFEVFEAMELEAWSRHVAAV